MKRQILALLLLTAGAGIKAQAPAADPIAPILRQIEQNNRRLQSAREALKADVLEIKSTNNLSTPR